MDLRRGATVAPDQPTLEPSRKRLATGEVIPSQPRGREQDDAGRGWGAVKVDHVEDLIDVRGARRSEPALDVVEEEVEDVARVETAGVRVVDLLQDARDVGRRPGVSLVGDRGERVRDSAR
ncbi:MAG: hypothetical protein R3A52_17775 [Polyangiales bacterium]